MKFLVRVRFANIINIINDKEVIPELLQSECNPKEIFTSVKYLLNHPDLMKSQLDTIEKTLKNHKIKQVLFYFILILIIYFLYPSTKTEFIYFQF